MRVKEQTWLTMQSHARFVDFNPDSGVLTFLAPHFSDKGKEELFDEPKELVQIVLDKQTPVDATLNTAASKTQRFVKVWGGGNAEELKKRLQSLGRFTSNADANRMADKLIKWLKEKWYPINPETNPGLADVQQGVSFAKWEGVLWREPQGESKVPVKIPSDPKGLTKRYIQTWGGGKKEMRARIRSALNFSEQEAKGLLLLMEKWLTETWYRTLSKDNKDPTVEDISDAFFDLEGFQYRIDTARWERILKYQIPPKKEKKTRKPKKVVELNVETQQGDYKLMFSIALPHFGRVGTGVLNWNARQPIAFLTNLRGNLYREIRVSEILRNEAVTFLGIDPMILRVIVPPIFEQRTMRQWDILAQSSDFLKWSGIDFALFEATSEKGELFSPPLRFLPLEVDTLDGTVILTHEVEINQMRGHGFSFEQKYENKKKKEEIHRGQVFIVKMRPQNHPDTWRVALAFYYQGNMPELVGVYVFPLAAERRESETEEPVGDVVYRFQNEVIQDEDDSIVRELSQSK